MKNIGECAFAYCSQLTDISMPNGVTRIESHVFEGCTDLTKITIPENVTSIDWSAFYICDNLTIYGYADSYAQRYATANNIPFEVIDKPTTTTTTKQTTTTTTEQTTTTKQTTTTTTTQTTTTTAKQTTTTQTTTSSTPTEPTAIYGDINLDGRVDITDAVLLNKACAGTVMLDSTAKKNADCNGDGEIGSDDAVVLLKFLVHLVNTLPFSE